MLEPEISIEYFTFVDKRCAGEIMIGQKMEKGN